MEAATFSTSAFKLKNILQRARQTGGHSTVLAGWAAVFEVEQEPAQVAGNIVKLCYAIDRHGGDLIRAKVSETIYGGVHSKLNRVVVESLANLGAPWDSLKQKITDDIFVGLDFSHSILESKGIVIPEDDNKIKSCLDLIDEIEKGIKVIDIDANLRSQLISQLESLKRALIDFKVFGENNIVKETLNVAFSNTTYESLLVDAGFDSLPEKFGSLMGVLHQIIKGFNDGAKFLENVTKYLPPLQ